MRRCAHHCAMVQAKRSSIVVVVGVVLFSLVGCGNKAKADENDCKAVVAHMIDDDPVFNADQIGSIRAAMTERCIEDKWSAEARKCLGNARGPRELDVCTRAHLTQIQNARAEDAMAKVTNKLIEQSEKPPE